MHNFCIICICSSSPLQVYYSEFDDTHDLDVTTQQQIVARIIFFGGEGGELFKRKTKRWTMLKV